MTTYDPYTNRFYDGKGNPPPAYDPYNCKVIDEQRAGDAGDYARMSDIEPVSSIVQSRYDDLDNRVDTLRKELDDHIDTLNKTDAHIIRNLFDYKDSHNALADRVRHFEQLNKMLINCVIICTTIISILGVIVLIVSAVAYDAQDRLRDEFYEHINSSVSAVMEVQNDTTEG